MCVKFEHAKFQWLTARGTFSNWGLNEEGRGRKFNGKPAISQKRWEIGPSLLLITNRKWHLPFQIAWQSWTLDDLERSTLKLGPTVFCGKFLPNSMGQIAKFCGSLQQNFPNSIAHCGPPFVRKLSSILLKKNCSYWTLAWCSVMLATNKEN